MAEQDNQGHFGIYVWLGVSGLLNLSGMASIADGFVTWAKFFHDIIDVYRATIRQPLAWFGQIVWPFGPIPGWVYDVFVIWMALVLALNIWGYLQNRETLFSAMHYYIKRQQYINAIVLALFLTIGLPFTILLLLWFSEWRNDAKRILLNFLLILATFTLLLFINWQIRQHGG